MKKTDVAMIVLIASLSVLVAWFVAGSIPGLKNDDTKTVMVKTAEVISPTVAQPDSAVFNKNAINPTVEVTIGGGDATSTLKTP